MMKKKIVLVLLLIAVVAGMAFAQGYYVPMPTNDLSGAVGVSQTTKSNSRTGQYITVESCYATDSWYKGCIKVDYHSNTRMVLGGRFHFWVYYKDGSAEEFTNSETLINANTTYSIYLKTKKWNQVQGITITYEERVKEKSYSPPPPKQKKDWVDRMFPMPKL